MNDLDACEAIRNLNPATDKLGKDRDFKDHTAHSLQWLIERMDDMDQRLQLIEGIIRSTDEKMSNM